MDALKARFENHPERHPGVTWEDVARQLDDARLCSLSYLEETGGEPDVLLYQGRLYVADFSPESPIRRSVCYDRAARLGRKRNPPATSACELAESNGLELVDEKIYLAMQELAPLDARTSSWIKTPEDMREQGGALFGIRRYNRTFIYCNGADSYYAARGFRACFSLE
jgi:hypothetical protein